jgi:hypothetical protein
LEKTTIGTSNQRQRVNHSPAVLNNANAMPLRTPQRIEIEREDALDILSCLVERSVAFENETDVALFEDTAENDFVGDDEDADEFVDEGEDDAAAKAPKIEANERDVDDDKISTFADVGAQRNAIEEPEVQSPPKSRRKCRATEKIVRNDSLPMEMRDAIDAIREISSKFQEDDPVKHARRMKAIDELLLSYTYAGEMKRAAKSASVWLRSIGRSGSSIGDEGHSFASTRQDSFPFSISVSRARNQSAGEEQESETASQFVDNMDVLGLKAMVHSAELNVKEKEEQIARLNEELSTCKAEIGRLNSASSRTEVREPCECTILCSSSATHSISFNVGPFLS